MTVIDKILNGKYDFIIPKEYGKICEPVTLAWYHATWKWPGKPIEEGLYWNVCRCCILLDKVKEENRKLLPEEISNNYITLNRSKMELEYTLDLEKSYNLLIVEAELYEPIELFREHKLEYYKRGNWFISSTEDEIAYKKLISAKLSSMGRTIDEEMNILDFVNEANRLTVDIQELLDYTVEIIGELSELKNNSQ